MPATGTARLLSLLLTLTLLASCGTGAQEEQGADTGEAAATPDQAETAPAAAEEATAEASPANPGQPAGDEPLRLGYLLPESGPLAFLGPPQIRAVELAVQDMNEAGGVGGGEVALVRADEAGDESVANQAVDRLLAEGVHAVIGAVSSGISLGVIDKIVGAERVQCSGSNTSRTFTDYDDDGYYFRTVPSNVLQAPILGELIVSDGYARIGILQRADDYGQSIGDAVTTVLEEQGAEVASRAVYDPNASTFDADVQEVISANPDAVLVIGFEEGAQIIKQLIESGYGPHQSGLYGTDGLGFGDLAERVEPGDPSVLEGMRGTAASSSFDPEFVSRLQEFAPELESTAFAPYFYDCAVLVGLAAVAAGTTDPSTFADEIVGITKDGTECGDFDECAALLEDGEDIDYVGKSGPLNFSEAGEPRTALYDIVEFDAEGNAEVVDTVTFSEE